MRATPILIVASFLLSGCLASENAPVQTPNTPDLPFAFDYGNATWPAGVKAREFVQSYVMTHPHRRSSQNTNTYMEKARDDLEGLLKGFNLTVQRHEYASGQNILGIKNGSVNPDQWIVFSAHYDTTGSTIFGAWDDGSGVAALLEIASATKEWKFPFTVVFAFFDEEERGLVGSRNFVEEFSQNEEIDLVANLNTDPPGLNWPCGDAQGPFTVETLYIANKKKPRYQWLHDALTLALDQTKVPKEVRNEEPGVTIVGPLRGGSDHASFHDEGIANFFLGGVPYTKVGPEVVLTYPLHTPLDTLEAMDARCTQGSYAEGLHTIVTALTHTVVNLATGGPVPDPD